MPTRELLNAKTQELESAELSVDDNNEIVATFKDGGVIKFPAGLTQKQFDNLIETHNDGNIGQEPLTEEYFQAQAKARNASLKLIGAEPDNANTMAEGGTTNAPSTDEATS